MTILQAKALRTGQRVTFIYKAKELDQGTIGAKGPGGFQVKWDNDAVPAWCSYQHASSIHILATP